MLEIDIQNSGNQSLPVYGTPGSAGLDLRANLEHKHFIHPMGRAIIPTGISLRIPNGYEGQVRPRSGLAAKSGVTVLNSPGTIDSDYRGEVKVILLTYQILRTRSTQGIESLK